MNIASPTEQLAEIRDEWNRRTAEPAEDLLDRIQDGRISDATAHVIFRAEPAERAAIVDNLVQRLAGRFHDSGAPGRQRMLEFCVKLALDFGSFLPAWRSAASQPEADLAGSVLSLCERLCRGDSAAADELQQRLHSDFLARLGAEAVSDAAEAQRIAAEAFGSGLGDYVRNMWRQYASSNMRRAAAMYLSGETATALGNDYAAFLDHALRVGVSSQTTNPVLIKLAWDTDKPGWDSRIDSIIRGSYDLQQLRAALQQSDAERDAVVRRINTLVTTAVVERNCRLLRDIFLMTDGREGYVNLQVSPDNYADSSAMVRQAVEVYQDLRTRLAGIPNVVIKVPATPAGRDAAAELTRLGIGVTVTLTFSLFQACPVAEVIRDSNALVSNIAIMNGRLAFPVRDELKANGVNGGQEAARWAGVAVARKAFQRLYNPVSEGGMGIDRARVRLLIASLRIYDDWLPDISELWGIPAITVFPNVRRALDAHPRQIDGNSVVNPTPAEAIRTMLSSELFRQAWWTEDDGAETAPQEPLTLAGGNNEAVAAWKPVRQTLDQFIDGYTAMNSMILERLTQLVR